MWQLITVSLFLLTGAFWIGWYFGFRARLAQEDLEWGDIDGPDEEPADVGSPLEWKQAGCVLRYPGNWTLEDVDLDQPEAMWTINSVESCFVMFVLPSDEVAAAEMLATHSEIHVSIMDDPLEEEFARWGRYFGTGIVLREAASPDSIVSVKRLFASSDPKRCFFVMECFFEDDRAMVSPGFELIESSFEVLDVTGEEETRE